MNSLRQFSRPLFPCANSFYMMALLIFPLGCGAVGPPIPPEEVGIEAKIREQGLDQPGKEESPTDDGSISPMEGPIELPDFYPLTTQ
jgi:hypothetical protein